MPDFSTLKTAKKDWRASRDDRNDSFVRDTLKSIVTACAENRASARQLLTDYAENLTPVWFNTQFPTCPYGLDICQFFGADPSWLELLYMSEKSEIFQRWLEASTNYDDGLRTLLLFKYGRLGAWAMSRDLPICAASDEATIIERRFTVGEHEGYLFKFVPLDEFIARLSSTWSW